MTWSYSQDPSTSDLDAVRFLVGDTDENKQLVSDEEIQYALSQHPDVRSAAVAVARAIQAKFARMADKSLGKMSISYSQIAEAFREKVTELMAAADTEIARTAPGITRHTFEW